MVIRNSRQLEFALSHASNEMNDFVYKCLVNATSSLQARIDFLSYGDILLYRPSKTIEIFIIWPKQCNQTVPYHK